MGDIINLAAERFARKPMTEEKALTLLSEFRKRAMYRDPETASLAVAKRFVQERPSGTEHLLAWRRRAGWTARDVGYAMGKSQNWLTEVERGRRSLRASDAVLLAQFYGITVDELMKAPPSESASG